MINNSADLTIIELTFNETDIDRLMPAKDDDAIEGASNEVMHVEVPHIKIAEKCFVEKKTKRLCVVDVKALV